MKKLIFTKGDETRPKFEDLTNAETYNSSIFSDIYDRAFSLIKEISNPARNVNNKHNRERNNIIAFIGERGSGKTSCLKSIYHSLNKQQGMALPIPIDGINVSFNNKLPIIDPSYFDEHSNIIEIVIAHMFKSFKDAVNKSNHSFDGDNMEKKRKLVKKFQEVKEALDCTKDRDIRFNSNDSIEQLSKLASGSNLHDSMEKLVECYLNYFKAENDKNSQMLVIAIDDLDVQTNHTYQMVEQIRKYLIIDNVLILMGVKLVQLSNLIKKKFLADFNDKDGDRDKGQEVDDMVARYLIKLLPLSHRLNLPNYNDMPEIELAISSLAVMDAHDGDDDSAAKINDDGENAQTSKHEQSDEIINLYETVLALIYKKTGLMFYNFNQESLIIPHNLRELLNLIAMLNNMSDGEKSKNRSIFKQYFIESWCLDRLTPKQYAFIHDLNECDAIRINQFVAEYVITEYHKYFENNHELLQCKNRPYYLVSIADVHSILNILSNSNETSIKRLVFAVKTVYSMILYSKFIEMQNENNIKFHANLLYKYFTNGVISYKSVNKLSHIFDYEKMIGGYVINSPKNVRCIDISECHKIYQKWFLKFTLANLKTHPQYDINEHGECADFNRFELYLLSTLHYKISDSETLNYYSSFPLYEYPKSGKLELNSTAIFYNITRYCNLYKIFKYINNINDSKHSDNDTKKINVSPLIIGTFRNKTCEDAASGNLENLELCKFFRLIQFFGNNSIIYNIVSNFNSIDYSKRSAIINIEVLELLEEYLSKINIQNMTNVADILKEVANFKYYVYKTRLKPEDTENNTKNKNIIYYLSTYYIERDLSISNILDRNRNLNANCNNVKLL